MGSAGEERGGAGLTIGFGEESQAPASEFAIRSRSIEAEIVRQESKKRIAVQK